MATTSDAPIVADHRGATRVDRTLFSAGSLVPGGLDLCPWAAPWDSVIVVLVKQTHSPLEKEHPMKKLFPLGLVVLGVVLLVAGGYTAFRGFEAKDLVLPEGVDLVEEPNRVIVAISVAKAEEEAAPAEGALAEGAPAEPEVIGRGKADEEEEEGDE